MPGAASLDLLEQELIPARLDAGKPSHRHALYLRDGFADLAEDALFLIFRQDRPRFGAKRTVHPRDDEIRPLVALALDHDLRNRYANAAAQLRQRTQFGYELMAQQRRKNLQDQGVITAHDTFATAR